MRWREHPPPSGISQTLCVRLILFSLRFQNLLARFCNAQCRRTLCCARLLPQSCARSFDGPQTMSRRSMPCQKRSPKNVISKARRCPNSSSRCNHQCRKIFRKAPRRKLARSLNLLGHHSALYYRKAMMRPRLIRHIASVSLTLSRSRLALNQSRAKPE